MKKKTNQQLKNGPIKSEYEQVDMLRLTFSQMDKNGDGMLTVSDVKTYLEEMGRFDGNEIVESWISLRDTNCDGYVTFDDFLISFAPSLKNGLVRQSPYLDALESLHVQRSQEDMYTIGWEMSLIFTRIAQSISEKSWLFTADDIPLLLQRENRPWCRKLLDGLPLLVDDNQKNSMIVSKQQNFTGDLIHDRRNEIIRFLSSLITPQIASKLGELYLFCFSKPFPIY